jgi:hypothetical protein
MSKFKNLMFLILQWSLTEKNIVSFRYFCYPVRKYMSMKKTKKTIGGAALLFLVITTLVVGLTLDLGEEESVSEKWTAEMLCKSWEQQKGAVQFYSTESGRERSYRIAMSQVRKNIRKNEETKQIIEKENREMKNYKERVHKMSQKICSPSEEFTKHFLESLDRL